MAPYLTGKLKSEIKEDSFQRSQWIGVILGISFAYYC
jgi:hypothetical protein